MSGVKVKERDRVIVRVDSNYVGGYYGCEGVIVSIDKNSIPSTTVWFTDIKEIAFFEEEDLEVVKGATT